VLTMEEILTQLRKKAKIDCEDELRQVVAEPSSEKNCIGHHGHDFPVTGKITDRKNYFPVTGSNFLFSDVIWYFSL